MFYVVTMGTLNLLQHGKKEEDQKLIEDINPAQFIDNNFFK